MLALGTAHVHLVEPAVFS